MSRNNKGARPVDGPFLIIYVCAHARGFILPAAMLAQSCRDRRPRLSASNTPPVQNIRTIL